MLFKQGLEQRLLRLERITLRPAYSSSCCTDVMTTNSSPSSLIHSGMGVPQNRVRLMAQSCAF